MLELFPILLLFEILLLLLSLYADLIVLFNVLLIDLFGEFLKDLFFKVIFSGEEENKESLYLLYNDLLLFIKLFPILDSKDLLI